MKYSFNSKLNEENIYIGEHSNKLVEDINEPKIVRRGYNEEDMRLFSENAIINLQKAQVEIQWLLNRGYNMKSITEFVGNSYQFSLRQRNALQRATSSKVNCDKRRKNLISNMNIKNKEIYIDGFNLIITLEVATSGGTLILCNDGTIRDIAGLRGTYKIIDKTDKAIEFIGNCLRELEIDKVKFFLDSPVSNSGRLKSRILKHSEDWSCNVEVELVNNPDQNLSVMERVVTSDSVILDNCISWLNLGRTIIENYIEDAKIINLSGEGKVNMKE